jgi:hypothetical protein
MIFYTGRLFPQWRGSALIGGLSAKGLVRVQIDGDRAREVERFDLGARIREVEQGPDGGLCAGGRTRRFARPPAEARPGAVSLPARRPVFLVDQAAGWAL